MRVKQMALKLSPSHNPFLQHPAMADPHSSKHIKEAWDLEGESMHSPPKPRKDPIHESEHIDISTSPSKEESDIEAAIPPINKAA